MGRWVLIVMSFAYSTCCYAAKVKASREASDTRFSSGKMYGSVQMRHHLNTYYDQDDYIDKREAAVHARMQLGSTLYGGFVDTYATLGIFKEPSTLQVEQRRPEINLDLYPIKTDQWILQLHNQARLPFHDDERDDYTGSRTVDQGTTFTFGSALTFLQPFMISSEKLTFKIGSDHWTRLYSRKQYATTDPLYEEDEEELPGWELTADVPEDENDIVVEDRANHGFSKWLTGISYEPSFLADLKAGVNVYHASYFYPIYEIDPDTDEASGDFHYGVKRWSYYRARLKYSLSKRITLANDLYHFHGGFFESKRRGEEQRYRNVARFICTL